jgi:hypothetical protein
MVLFFKVTGYPALIDELPAIDTERFLRESHMQDALGSRYATVAGARRVEQGKEPLGDCLP